MRLSMTYRKPAPYKTPSVERMNQLSEARLFTPDGWQLEQKTHHLLFIVDDLMREHRNHDLLGNPEDLSTAFTLGKYNMWKKKLGLESYPVPLSDHCPGVPLAHIKGELYRVPTDLFTVGGLDRYYTNGVMFERRRTALIIPSLKRRVVHQPLSKGTIRNRDVENVVTHFKSVGLDSQPAWTYRTDVCTAWMYFGVNEQWEEQLSAYHCGVVKTFKPNWKKIDEYYYFSTMETRT